MTCTLRVLDLSTGAERSAAGLDPTSSIDAWSAAGIGLGGSACFDPATTALAAESCPGAPDTSLSQSFSAGAELPDGWRLELRLVPGQPQMSFTLEAIALGPSAQEVVIDALGIFHGNG